MFWLTLPDSRNGGGRGGGLSGWQEMNEREKSFLPSALLQPVPRSIDLHLRESENEREQSRKDWTSHGPTFSLSGTLQWMKGDHRDDMEFIPHNSSVISVIGNISFTVAVRINFRRDSERGGPLPISHTWLFTWVWICRPIKWPSSTYEFAMYIQISHKIPTHFIFYYACWAAINHIITGMWLHVTEASAV